MLSLADRHKPATLGDIVDADWCLRFSEPERQSASVIHLIATAEWW